MSSWADQQEHESICGQHGSKDKNPDTLIEDLKQTFKNLKRWKWKLNPNKCVFGVPLGQLLGFLVCRRGIKASAKQIQAITEMGPP
jgi:hypothetical protein